MTFYAAFLGHLDRILPWSSILSTNSPTKSIKIAKLHCCVFLSILKLDAIHSVIEFWYLIFQEGTNTLCKTAAKTHQNTIRITHVLLCF